MPPDFSVLRYTSTMPLNCFSPTLTPAFALLANLEGNDAKPGAKGGDWPILFGSNPRSTQTTVTWHLQLHQSRYSCWTWQRKYQFSWVWKAPNLICERQVQSLCWEVTDAVCKVNCEIFTEWISYLQWNKANRKKLMDECRNLSKYKFHVGLLHVGNCISPGCCGIYVLTQTHGAVVRALASHHCGLGSILGSDITCYLFIYF